jgi:tetratricopeptide (TPR) repeat protein
MDGDRLFNNTSTSLIAPTSNPPLTPVQAMLLAEDHKQAGRLTEAENILRQIIAAVPNFDPAYHSLGLIAFHVGKLPLAIELIVNAISINRTVSLYHRNLGELCRRLGRIDDAIAAGRRAVELNAKDLDAHYNLGIALIDKGACEAATQSLRQAIEIDPKHGMSWNNLGSALEKLGNQADAEAAYAQAIALNPQHAEAQNNLGAIYSEQGRLEEAREHFNAAIEANPDFMDAHFNLCSLKTYRADDPHLAMLNNGRSWIHTLPENARIRYWFAVGKAYEDVGRYDESFSAYAEGNRLQHALLPQNEAGADHTAKRVKAVFTKELFEKYATHDEGARQHGKAHIFIVGMPRSGTTLLEQILSSHPGVHGAGELSYLNDVVTESAQQRDTPFPDIVSTLPADEFSAMGKAYAERVRKLAPDAQRITDKMPGNFFYIGMIQLMLPGAKIIHAMRDPMDSCFSCFGRLFNSTMKFAYSLDTLGRYYTRYIQLMRHWHSVLPAGAILDLRYEDMIADTEGQARRIMDYLDLPWDDKCLAFHENKRPVKTASVAQVRRPIYKTSVARWKNFETHLAPLLEIVKDYR